jgi:hypothetical protein
VLGYIVADDDELCFRPSAWPNSWTAKSSRYTPLLQPEDPVKNRQPPS